MSKSEKQNIKLDKVDDKTAYENLLIKYADLENKIADIKANCDLAIEGRVVKIMELEDHLAEEVELHLHAEEYTKSLEQENNKLLDVINNQDVKIADFEKKNAELKKEVEKHKWNDIFLEDCASYDKKIAEEYTTLQERIEKLENENAELELELTVEKDLHQEETNLHLHAEEYIKSLEQQIEKLIDFVLSKTECCDVCPETDTCINNEGTCPYAGILAKGEEEVTREWLMQFISRR